MIIKHLYGASVRRLVGHRLGGHRLGGQALIVAMILLILAAILVLSNVYFMQQTARYQMAHGRIVQERYLAEAGLQMTLQKLNDDDDFSEQVQVLTSGQLNPFDTTTAAQSITWGGGNITVVIEPY